MTNNQQGTKFSSDKFINSTTGELQLLCSSSRHNLDISNSVWAKMSTCSTCRLTISRFVLSVSDFFHHSFPYSSNSSGLSISGIKSSIVHDLQNVIAISWLAKHSPFEIVRYFYCKGHDEEDWRNNIGCLFESPKRVLARYFQLLLTDRTRIK